jgi:FkbH-like protein
MDSLDFNLSWLTRPPADFNALCSAAMDHPEGLGVQLQALASYALDENQLMRLARIVAKARAAHYSLSPLTAHKLGLVTNSTSDFVASALVATALRYGIALECIPAAYDQAVQESLSPESDMNRSAPQAVLIALDWRGLPLHPCPGKSAEAQATVDGVLNYLRMIRDGIRGQSGAICILQNVAAPPETLFGSLDRVILGTRRQIIDGVNLALASAVRDTGDRLFDVAALAETVGLAHWHSPAEWNMAKLPFSQRFLPLYAEHVCRLLAALCGKTRRCLVLDLDDTLWGGVIGDDGLKGIQITQGDAVGEAFLDFQRYILELRSRGVVLAVSSRNEDQTARLPFRHHPEMLLREEHFALFHANWSDKASNIQSIAQELSLGLDAFVFVDDNPFERELVRTMLPSVAVPEMPVDPALYARTLSAAGYFEAAAFSGEDQNRAGYYDGNARRAALQKTAGDLQGYLASLKMEILFQPFDETGRARITQLINRSNQFNLTTRRYSEADVARMETAAEYFTMQVRLADTFGDNGMICVVICRAAAMDQWEIDTWLMSCRVLGRCVEQMVLRELLENAAARGIRRLVGVYVPTGRNKLVEHHYSKLGFTQVEQQPEGSTVWKLEVAGNWVEAAPPMIVRSLGFRQKAPLAATENQTATHD